MAAGAYEWGGGAEQPEAEPLRSLWELLAGTALNRRRVGLARPGRGGREMGGADWNVRVLRRLEGARS